jgi:hypothetical protein
MPEDAIAFLEACAADHAEVLGWELWLIDHRWDNAARAPTPAPGIWCGLIPVEGTSVPAVFQGSGDCEQTRLEISRLDLGDIALQYCDYIRINFTLAG